MKNKKFPAVCERAASCTFTKIEKYLKKHLNICCVRVYRPCSFVFLFSLSIYADHLSTNSVPDFIELGRLKPDREEELILSDI